MPKYKVVFAVSYEVEAEEENDAVCEAERLLVESFDERGHLGLTDIFGVNADLVSETEES